MVGARLKLRDNSELAEADVEPSWAMDSFDNVCAVLSLYKSKFMESAESLSKVRP